MFFKHLLGLTLSQVRNHLTARMTVTNVSFQGRLSGLHGRTEEKCQRRTGCLFNHFYGRRENNVCSHFRILYRPR